MIVVDDVHKHFGGFRAVDGASFEIAKGSITGLIGPNGAGKTSLFNVISGLLAPCSGQVRLGGRSLANKSPEARARWGMARSFQTSRIFPELSLLDNIALGLRACGPDGYAWWRGRARHHASLERASTLLAGTPLVSRGEQPAADLSYGEQRILDVLIALAQKPRLLLLDEPTAGLSAAEAQAIMALVRSAHNQCAILLISHDIDIVFSTSDRVAVLSQGSLLTIGEPAAVRAHPQAIRAYLGDLATP